MGLLSKIKKAAVGLLAGAKKVFKSVAKVAAKVLSNKWVQRAMMVVSLVVPVIGMATAGWTAAAGQGVMAQIGGALGNVARGIGSMVVKAVTTPIKMLAEGGSKVAGMFGADGMAATLGNAAKSVGGLSNSIFGNVAKDSFGQIMGKMGIGDAQAVTGETPAVGSIASNGAAAPAGTDLTAMSKDALAGSGNTFSDNMLSTGTQNTINAGAAPATSGGSLLNRAASWVEKNPTIAKTAFSAIGSALAPDESELLEQKYKLQAQADQKTNDQWKNFNPTYSTPASPTTPSGYQPIDYTQRAQSARDFINSSASPLLRRLQPQGAQ